jgi:ubiquinone/menaquinone biosynthesis C-methylase UbiE
MNTLPKNPFPPSLAFFLDLPLRRLLIDREKFLRGMGVKEGDRVLEVGCGPGFFTETLSLIVGEKGKVYAQDIEEAMLRKIKKKLPSFRYPNVIPLLCNSSSLELPDSSCDVILCANVIEEIYKEGELEGTVKEIGRVLKPGGILFIKEHRFGGTEPIIKETEALLVRFGYDKVSEEKTLLSYNSKLVRLR